MYSPFKAAHHREHIECLKEGKLVLPTQIQVDLTNKCNHNCPYCFYRCAKNDKLNALFNERDFVPTERVMHLLDELSSIKWGVKTSLQYTGGGEPAVHPDFCSIINETVRRGIGFALVSNGAELPVNIVPQLACADWVRISVDAATKSTYAKSQGAKEDDFDYVIDLLGKLRNASDSLVLGASFIVNPMNYKEVVDFTRMMKGLGLSNVRLSVAYTPRGIGLYKDIWHEIEDLARESKKFEDKNFKVFDLIVPHLENLDLRQKGYTFCGYQHFTAVIGADGEVYPCCTLKYNSATKFGNINKESFKDIWFGDVRKEWLLSDHLHNVCDKAPCWMDRKNAFISYLCRDNPPHVNYI